MEARVSAARPERSDGAPRILVTGANGFIGHAYCAHLAQRGVPFVGAVRGLDAGAGPVHATGAVVAIGDFATADWAALIADHDVDCIVHLAARSHRIVDDDPDPPAAYRRDNVDATRALLHAAEVAGVRRFVFTSSVKVHGDYSPPGVVWRESDPVAPRDEYARSKAEAEALVREVGHRHGIATVILRFPLVYGPGVKANFAALADAVRRRRPLPLGGIRNRRSLLGLTNVCAAIDAARLNPAAAGQTFLVSDGDDVSTPELVRAIADALGVRPRLIALPPWLLEALMTIALRRDDARRLMQSLAIDSARIRRSLAWAPPSTLADELQRMVRSLPRT